LGRCCGEQCHIFMTLSMYVFYTKGFTQPSQKSIGD
jgi:hypothetical protein